VSRRRFRRENVERHRPDRLRLEDGHCVQTTVARHDLAPEAPQAIGRLRAVTVDGVSFFLESGRSAVPFTRSVPVAKWLDEVRKRARSSSSPTA